MENNLKVYQSNTKYCYKNCNKNGVCINGECLC